MLAPLSARKYMNSSFSHQVNSGKLEMDFLSTLLLFQKSTVA